MDETAVTIVAVVVAGVVGPVITAWATARVQNRRFDHERRLHDLDDLRRELDQLGDTFAELIHAMVPLFTATPRGETQWQVRRAKYEQCRSVALERTARLKIRVGSAAPVADAAALLLNAINDLVDGGWDQHPDDVKQSMTNIGEINRLFYDRAYELIGARIAPPRGA